MWLFTEVVLLDLPGQIPLGRKGIILTAHIEIEVYNAYDNNIHFADAFIQSDAQRRIWTCKPLYLLSNALPLSYTRPEVLVLTACDLWKN